MRETEEVCVIILVISIIMSFHYMVISVLNLPDDTILLRGAKVDL